MHDTKSPTGHRVWLPAVFAVLAAAGILYVRLQPEWERNAKGWLTAAITILAILLFVIWFMFFSRFRGRVRWLGAGLLALFIFAASQTLRVSGAVDGTGLPKLAWRWSRERALPAPATAPTITASRLVIPDVPQFFGPNRDGVVREARFGRDWQTSPPRELWRQPVGLGWSAFAIVGGRAFTQEQRNDQELVTCYDVSSGQLLWAQGHTTRFSQWQGGDGPRATPTVDRDHVFTYGATGRLDCRNAATGALVWSRDVLTENGLKNLEWGTSASPLVDEERVIITGGQTSGPTLLAFQRTAGEPLWNSGTDKASYASPVFTTLAGRRVVLSANAASLTAHDPATGVQLLDHPWGNDKFPHAAQPLVLPGDRVFLSAGYGKGCALLRVTPAADGRLSATTVWKNLRMKTQFNSVAAREGFIYGLDDGLLACVEVATGERKWKDGRYGSGQTLLVDDLVLIQTEPGAVVLAAARPDGFAELARLPALRSKTWNHPTLAGRYLLVRNDQEAICYELPAPVSSR